MKTLVIGRTGQLAMALMEMGGGDVTALGRPDADITIAASLDAAIRTCQPDIVVNAAAYTAVDKAESEPDAARALNATGARLLAIACAQHGLPLLHVSTDYVFAGAAERPYRPDDQTGPINTYGWSKLEGERAVAEFCPRHIILRTSWVHSPWGNNFVRTMLRLAASRREISVVNDQFGNPTYAPHLAAAILTAGRRVVAGDAATLWGTYHATGAGSTTWYGLASEIFRIAEPLGHPSPAIIPIGTEDYQTPAQRPMNSRLDTSSFLQHFGHDMPPWRDGVAACVKRLVPDPIK
jgi:dTDP-4-dehydrorhamnose reductase